MALEFRFGRMVRSIEACGKIIERTEKVLSGMPMETTMKANSKMINQTATESIHALMVQYMKVYGWMIFSTDKVRRNGQTSQAMLETIMRERDKASVRTHGRMIINIAENGLTMLWKALALTSGQMDENMKDTGKTI